jgi:hypothetical protein
MRVLPFAVLAAFVAAAPVPASAQKLKDVLGAIGDQATGGRNRDRDRDAYERGREDQARHEAWRRDEGRHDREARRWEERHYDRDR